MIKQYVKKRNQKVGILVALPINEKEVGIGWSRAHSQLDEYNDEMGHEVAIGRSMKKTDFDKIPYSFKKDIDNFIKRCEKYFKDKEIPQVNRAKVKLEMAQLRNELDPNDIYLDGSLREFDEEEIE